jgi:cobalt-zinc-cadmium efflux system outer membrane protein
MLRMKQLPLISICLAAATAAHAQQPITRASAIESAMTHDGRISLAAADTSAALAQLLAARSLQNPAFSAAYSKSPPQLHFTFELPVDLPSLRRARVGSAQAALRASAYRYRFERAAAVLDVDTTYTRALAASARARLSAANAGIADSVLQITIERRDAGDASELDVELARVNAGQEHNLAASDSLDLISVLADLAAIAAIPSQNDIVLADTLVLPDTIAVRVTGDPLPIAAALQSVLSGEKAVSAERRSVFGSPALMAGVETHDPTGDEKGLLPTFGITLPIPFLNRNKGGIMAATAGLTRARAELSITRAQYAASLSHWRRRRATAYGRANRDRTLLESANRVASMSVRAYREGATPIANVMEAERSARDVLRQYVDDLADAWIADAVLRVLTLTTGP